jgi:hypothetical protein
LHLEVYEWTFKKFKPRKTKGKKRAPLAKIIQVNLKKKNKTERKVKGGAVRLEFMVGYVIGESFFHVIRIKSETLIKFKIKSFSKFILSLW